MNGLKPQIVEKDNKDQAQNATESRAENREALDPNNQFLTTNSSIGFAICALSVLGKVTVKRWNPNICEQLKRCPQIKSIEVLEFPNCGLTDIDAEKIQDLLLFGIPQLKKLKLQNNQLGDKGIQLICRGIRRGDCHYDQLAYVNFSNNHITRLGMEKIVKLIKFTEGAIYVDVQDNEVGYKGLKDFIEAKHWETLNVKHMLNCDTRHDDQQLNLKPFSVLHTKMLFIKDFWFEDNHMTQMDIQIFVEVFRNLPLCSIQTLKFKNEYINDIALYYIGAAMACRFLYTLKLLAITDTYITFDGILNFFTQIYKHGGTLQLDRLIYNGYSKGTENQRARFISNPPADAIKNDLPYMNLDINFVHIQQTIGIQSFCVRFIYNLSNEDYENFLDMICKGDYYSTALKFVKVEGEREHLHIQWLIHRYFAQKFTALTTVYLKYIAIPTDFYSYLFSKKNPTNYIEFISIEHAKKMENEISIDAYKPPVKGTSKITPNSALNANRGQSPSSHSQAMASPIQKSPLGMNMINNSSKEILTTPSSRAASFKEQEIELQNVEDIQANEFETDLKEIQKCIDNDLNNLLSDNSANDRSVGKIKYMNLNDCDIDDNDMKFIIKYLFTTTTLEVVDLENNKITDKGFDMLFAIYNYVTDFISKHPATLTPQPVDSTTTETHKRPRETYVPSIPKIPIIHLENNELIHWTQERLQNQQTLLSPITFDKEDVKTSRCLCH